MTTNGIGGFGMQQMGLSGNPEADAMRYAQAKGISLDEAKAELKSQFGDPQPPAPNSIFANQSQLMQMQIQNMPQGSSLFNYPAPQTGLQPPAPQTPEQMLGAKYGIPPEIVAQGDDAIRKYAQDHNISLPSKNNTTTSTTSTSTTATTTSSTAAASTKKVSTSSLYSDLPKTDNAFDDVYNSYDRYKNISKSMNYTSAEKKAIKQETKAYKKEIDSWYEERRNELETEYKNKRKSCSSRAERKALKEEYQTTLSEKLSQYVEQKFSEKYPDVDFRAVLHNVNQYASNKGTLARNYYVPTSNS